jgi:hypothetical protein
MLRRIMAGDFDEPDPSTKGHDCTLVSQMTIRDMFACDAMSGILASDKGEGRFPSALAASSYSIADAMMKARNA